jgi:uncharacterized protein
MTGEKTGLGTDSSFPSASIIAVPTVTGSEAGVTAHGCMITGAGCIIRSAGTTLMTVTITGGGQKRMPYKDLRKAAGKSRTGHPNDTEENLRIAENGLIWQVRAGSAVSGTAISATSDEDQLGVCIEPPSCLLGLDSFEQWEYRSASDEQWKPVVGWEDFYEVSNKGRVRSRNKVLRAIENAHGYIVVNLTGAGQRSQRKIHSLVLEAFAGPCPEGQEALHGPGGQQDNRWPQNLSWGTREKNVADKLRDGTHQINQGGRGGSSKFKGVSSHKASGKWSAQIKIDGENKYLGLFTDEIEAALAYDSAAIKAWGPEAYTNSRAPEMPQSPKSRYKDLDITIYSLRKFCGLLLAGNPSLISTLYTPPEHTLYDTDLGRELRELAPLLVSKKAGEKFLGYLKAQREAMLSGNGKGRDVTRKELVEKYGYDVKYAGHVVRLAYQGCEYMQSGKLTLPMAEEERLHVQAVRRGEYTMDDVLDFVEEKEDALRYMIDVASIWPRKPDYDAVSEWLVRAYQSEWARRGIVTGGV